MEGGFSVMSTREERWAAFDRAVGQTLTSADWAAALRRERAGLGPSALAVALRAGARAAATKKILNPGMGETQSREMGKIN